MTFNFRRSLYSMLHSQLCVTCVFSQNWKHVKVENCSSLVDKTKMRDLWLFSERWHSCPRSRSCSAAGGEGVQSQGVCVTQQLHWWHLQWERQLTSWTGCYFKGTEEALKSESESEGRCEQDVMASLIVKLVVKAAERRWSTSGRCCCCWQWGWTSSWWSPLPLPRPPALYLAHAGQWKLI